MKVAVYSTSNSAEYLQAAKPWLYQDESGNNTLLSIATQIGSPTTLLQPPYWFAHATTKDGKAGSAVCALPDGLVLSDMSYTHCESILYEMLREQVIPVRLYAPNELAQLSAEIISDHSGHHYRWGHQYRAMNISAPPYWPYACHGELRKARLEDVECVTRFGEEYDKEMPAIVKVSDYFLTRLRAGDLYLWVDEHSDDVRAVVALSGRTKTVVRIAGVFTPKDFRGNGFASSAVAAVTRECFDVGYKTVTLVSDIKDDTAQKMYRDLGFEPIHERTEILFTDPTEDDSI